MVARPPRTACRVGWFLRGRRGPRAELYPSHTVADATRPPGGYLWSASGQGSAVVGRAAIPGRSPDSRAPTRVSRAAQPLYLRLRGISLMGEALRLLGQVKNGATVPGRNELQPGEY